MIAIVVFILILSFLVIIHELGHFIAAKKAGIGVEEFGLGLPPRIWGKRIGETIYSINLLPFGGFVKLLGEDPTDERRDLANSFYVKSVSLRLLVVTAGVVMNFLLGVVLFYLVLLTSGFRAEFPLLVNHNFRFANQGEEVVVTGVEKGSPAEASGLSVGDVVLAINGVQIETIGQLQSIVAENRGRKIVIEVRKNQQAEAQQLEAIPRADPALEAPLGVNLGKIVILSYSSVAQKVFAGFSHAVNLIEYSTKIFARLVALAFEERSVSPISEGVAGPIGIAGVTAEVVGLGIKATLQFVALLSLNLAVLNILPLPALDGGRLLFLLVEAATRRRVYPQFEKLVHSIGFVLLLILILLVTYNDIVRLVTGR